MSAMKSIACIFPGQGAQTVGMGKTLYDTYDEARKIFEEADEALGFKLSELCFQGPEADLGLTANTQPAILTVSIAALRALESRVAVTPACLAGHSLGEYAALIAGGALSFRDGVRAVRKRGELMQEAVPEGQGGMAAVLGLERDQIKELCRNAADGEILTPANFNCPGQTVISGHTSALDRAMVMAKEMGARRAVKLAVSAPFHCRLMEPAGRKLADYLDSVEVNRLNRPVVTNVEARGNQDSARIRELLVKQLSFPVLWEDSVNYMLQNGIDTFVEIGPGKVLTGLIKRIDKSATLMNVEDSDGLDAVVKRLEGETVL